MTVMATFAAAAAVSAVAVAGAASAVAAAAAEAVAAAVAAVTADRTRQQRANVASQRLQTRRRDPHAFCRQIRWLIPRNKRTDLQAQSAGTSCRPF